MRCHSSQRMCYYHTTGRNSNYISVDMASFFLAIWLTTMKTKWWNCMCGVCWWVSTDWYALLSDAVWKRNEWKQISEENVSFYFYEETFFNSHSSPDSCIVFSSSLRRFLQWKRCCSHVHCVCIQCMSSHCLASIWIASEKLHQSSILWNVIALTLITGRNYNINTWSKISNEHRPFQTILHRRTNALLQCDNFSNSSVAWSISIYKPLEANADVFVLYSIRRKRGHSISCRYVCVFERSDRSPSNLSISHRHRLCIVAWNDAYAPFSQRLHTRTIGQTIDSRSWKCLSRWYVCLWGE